MHTKKLDIMQLEVGKTMTKYPITPERKEKLENRLTYLKEEKLKALNKDIKYFRSFCNFTEDTPFDETLDKQFETKKQIQDIETVLNNSEVNHSKNSTQKFVWEIK